MKNPYPEEKKEENWRIEDSIIGGQRLAAKWSTDQKGNEVVLVANDRNYKLIGFDVES